MPVLELSMLVVERRTVLRRHTPINADMLQLVVFSHDNAHVGLIVDQILDIVEEELVNQRPPGRPGVLGSVVLSGRVTELLDVEAALRRAQPGVAWAEVSAAGNPGEEVGRDA
jgi:two-component system chemotaxis sensor kinase CheA